MCVRDCRCVSLSVKVPTYTVWENACIVRVIPEDFLSSHLELRLGHCCFPRTVVAEGCGQESISDLNNGVKSAA